MISKSQSNWQLPLAFTRSFHWHTLVTSTFRIFTFSLITKSLNILLKTHSPKKQHFNVIFICKLFSSSSLIRNLLVDPRVTDWTKGNKIVNLPHIKPRDKTFVWCWLLSQETKDMTANAKDVDANISYIYIEYVVIDERLLDNIKIKNKIELCSSLLSWQKNYTLLQHSKRKYENFLTFIKSLLCNFGSAIP